MHLKVIVNAPSELDLRSKAPRFQQKMLRARAERVGTPGVMDAKHPELRVLKA